MATTTTLEKAPLAPSSPVVTLPPVSATLPQAESRAPSAAPAQAPQPHETEQPAYSDRFALGVWVVGAGTMAVLLLWDLVVGLFAW